MSTQLTNYFKVQNPSDSLFGWTKVPPPLLHEKVQRWILCCQNFCISSHFLSFTGPTPVLISLSLAFDWRDLLTILTVYEVLRESDRFLFCWNWGQSRTESIFVTLRGDVCVCVCVYVCVCVCVWDGGEGVRISILHADLKTWISRDDSVLKILVTDFQEMILFYRSE